MKKIGKLVRNRMPEILADSGVKATFQIATKDEYGSYLEQQLEEAVADYIKYKDPECLLTIHEAVLALANDRQGDSEIVFLDKCRKKMLERGSLSKRVILLEIEEDEE